MEVFLGAFVLMVLAVCGMAVGVVFGGKKLSGSCGGRLPDGTVIGDCLCDEVKQEACAAKQLIPQHLCEHGGTPSA